MPPDAQFAPYRLVKDEPLAAPEEAADDLVASPLVLSSDADPSLKRDEALCEILAFRALGAAGPCQDADGQPAGMGGPPRSCSSSPAQRGAVRQAVNEALRAGFRGVLFDRPDSAHAKGLYGAGFCPDCQRAFARHLEREYGENFEAIDYLRLARTALAEASGAVTFDRLPFGRDFWRFRHEALFAAVSADIRAARDAGRLAGRPFFVAAQFEALGPSELRSARLADAAVFPAIVPEGGTGIGLMRLLRAAMGRRPAAVAPKKLSPGDLGDLAAVAASCGIGIASQGRRLSPEVASVRRLTRLLSLEGRTPGEVEPVMEAAVLYSHDSDLWTGGHHLDAVLSASEALARAHVQAPIVTRLSDVPRDVPLILAEAAALSTSEAKEIVRRLDAGAGVLTFGPAAQVDETGHSHEGVLPAGKPTGVRVGTGTLAELPPLTALRGGQPPDMDLLEKGLVAVLGRGHRAAGVVSRRPVLVSLDRTPASIFVHLVSLGPTKAQGVTLLVGVKVAGGARRARFLTEAGDDVRIPMNPSGQSVSTVLPSFKGYAVLVLSS